MATITRENIDTLHDKINIKLDKADFMPGVEKKLKEYTKKAVIPGFRKGMVPLGMIRKMYGPVVFNEEVINAVDHQMKEYMKQEKISIFAQPLIMDTGREPLDFNRPDDIDFTFEVGLKPEIDVLPIIKASHLTKYKIAITDQMLDNEVARIQERYGMQDEQHEVTSIDNIIDAEYALCDEQGIVADDVVVHEDSARLENLPVKFHELLMGKVKDDTVIFRPAEVCTPEELADFMKDPLKAGLESADLNYKLTIKKISLLVPEPVGPGLFVKVFKDAEVKDEAEFREKLRGELSPEFDRLTGERLQNEIYEYLVHNTPITLPVAFMKRWITENSEKPKTAEEVEHEYPGFEHRLKWQLISDKVMADAGIKITREEVERDIKNKVLGYFGLRPDDEDQAPWMDAYMAKMSKDEKMLEETYQRLLVVKLFSVLEATFPVEEKEISEEDFFKLQDAHATHHHHHHHEHEHEHEHEH